MDTPTRDQILRLHNLTWRATQPGVSRDDIEYRVAGAYRRVLDEVYGVEAVDDAYHEFLENEVL